MESRGIEKTNKGEVAMAAMLESRTLSVSIGRHPGKVYEFVSDPENLPKWAKGQRDHLHLVSIARHAR
jgi:uncharacterized protein YndB with AHSA1/START domain